MSEGILLGSNLRRETAAGYDFGEATLLTNQSTQYDDTNDPDEVERHRVNEAKAQKELYDYFQSLERK